MMNATQKPLLSVIVTTATGLVEPLGAFVSAVIIGDKFSAVDAFEKILVVLSTQRDITAGMAGFVPSLRRGHNACRELPRIIASGKPAKSMRRLRLTPTSVRHGKKIPETA